MLKKLAAITAMMGVALYALFTTYSVIENEENKKAKSTIIDSLRLDNVRLQIKLKQTELPKK